MSADAIPDDWTPQPWLTPYTKRELQWLAQQLHDRNTKLQIQNRQLRQEAS